MAGMAIKKADGGLFIIREQKYAGSRKQLGLPRRYRVTRRLDLHETGEHIPVVELIGAFSASAIFLRKSSANIIADNLQDRKSKRPAPHSYPWVFIPPLIVPGNLSHLSIAMSAFDIMAFFRRPTILKFSCATEVRLNTASNLPVP